MTSLSDEERRERERTRKREWKRLDYEKHPEKYRAASTRFYWKNRDAILGTRVTYLREYYETNKVRIATKQREYSATHSAEAVERVRQWKLANPGRARINAEHGTRRRRARLHLVISETYTSEDVIALWGTLCHICLTEIDMEAPRSTKAMGWEVGLHIDHVIPISKNGPDTLANVRPSHGLCNLKKQAN